MVSQVTGRALEYSWLPYDQYGKGDPFLSISPFIYFSFSLPSQADFGILVELTIVRTLRAPQTLRGSKPLLKALRLKLCGFDPDHIVRMESIEGFEHGVGYAN